MDSRLGYYMRTLEISGRDIAQIVHVDPSLVSKWKNGSRKLRKESNEAKLLSSYLLNVDVNKKDSFFEKCFSRDELLKSTFKHGNLLKRQWMVIQLICDDGELPFLKPVSNIKPILHDSDRTITMNNDETHKMLCNFLDEAIVNKTPQLIFHITGSYSWIKDFINYETIYDYLTQYSRIGSLELSIGISSPYNLDSEFKTDPTLLKQLLPFYKDRSFKLAIGNSSSLGSYWFVLADGIGVLKGLCLSEHKYPNGYTHYISDQPAVLFHHQYITNELNTYLQLGKRYKRHHLKEVLLLVQENGLQRDNSYFVSTQLFFTSMSRPLLVDIMNSNGFSDSLQKMTLDIYTQLNYNFQQNVSLFDNRHVYCYETLEILAMKERFVYHHLTLITNRPVYITRNQFIQHIQDMKARIKLHPRHQVSIVKEKVFRQITSVQNIWLKDSNVLMMWHPESLDETVIIKQDVVIWQFIKEINLIWQSDHLTHNSNESNLRQLNKIIQIAQSNNVEFEK